VKNLLAISLLQHPRLARLFGLFMVVVFGALGVSSLIDVSQLSDAPSVVTMSQFAETLKTQDRYWAIIPNPQWDCSTLLHTKVGDDMHTEIFIRDPENSIAILVTYIDPIECGDLDRAQAIGVGWLMSEKHIQNLEQEGRLASFRNYRTLASLCTTCGKQNSTGLLVISAIFVVIGLAIYPLISSARREVERQSEEQMSFLKNLLGGASKNANDTVETMKRRQQAATEVLGIFQEHLSTTFESHPATALISAAWLAATSLYRSMGYPQDVEPGTVVVSDSINPKWPKMINLYLSVLEKDGINLNRDDMIENVHALKIPPEYQPKKDMPQIQALLQDQYNQIMRKHGFDYEEGAQVGVFACAIMTNFHCIANKDLEPRLAAEIVSLGFLEGAITSPAPLK
jgi:hypothetical protein